MIYVPMAWRDNDATLPATVHLVAEVNAMKTISGMYRIVTHIDDYPHYRFDDIDYYRHVINRKYGFHLLVVHNGHYGAYPNTFEVRKALDLNLPKMLELLKSKYAAKRGA